MHTRPPIRPSSEPADGWDGDWDKDCGGYPGYPKPMPYPGYPKPGYGKCETAHVVKPGETLYQIGMYYGVPAEQIAWANNLANPNMVYAGQTLCIP